MNPVGGWRFEPNEMSPPHAPFALARGVALRNYLVRFAVPSALKKSLEIQ